MKATTCLERLAARKALADALNSPWLEEDDLRDILAQFDFVPRGEYDSYDNELDEEQE